MLARILREGFAQAHRRPGLILLDVFWKAVWLALTLVGLLIVAWQFVSHLQWPATNIRAVDALVAASLLRQAWNEYGGELLGGLLAVVGLSVLVWLLLEAIYRRKLVVAGFSPRPGSERGLKPATTGLIVFVGTNVAKLAILTASAVVIVLLADGSREAAVATIPGFVALAFLLAVIDTLIRTDAVDLLGVDLLGVTGLIGTLLLFEGLIGASLFIVVVFGFLNVSSATEAIAMFAVTTLVLFLFTFLHSYLLVVRFSAVDIMRRNVTDV
jgi:hypothetical protein